MKTLVFKEVRQWQIASDTVLPTLRPVASDGSTSGPPQKTGATYYYSEIDDDPDTPTTADYIYNPANVSGHIFLSLTDMPSSFSSMDSLQVDVDLANSGFSDDTCTVYAQVFQSNETATTTEEVTLGTQISSGPVTQTFTSVLAGDKTIWDGALLRIRWVYATNKNADDGELRVTAAELDGAYTASSPTPELTQNHYRWRDDTTALDTGGGYLATEDNGYEEAVVDSIYRLRMEIANTGTATSSGQYFQLEYSLKSGSNCDTTWVKVATSSVTTQHWQNATSTRYANHASTTASLLTGVGTRVNGYAVESPSSVTGTSTIGNGWFSEFEYAITPTATSTGGTNYCFRLTDNGATTNFVYY